MEAVDVMDPCVDVDTLGVKALRELISSAGLSHVDCIEKSELRARAREALEVKKSEPPAAAAASSEELEALQLEDDERANLDTLLPELIAKIAEKLHDVFLPKHISSLARSCKSIKVALKDPLNELKLENKKAKALCVKCGNVSASLWKSDKLAWGGKDLIASDIPVLANIFRSKATAQLEQLMLGFNLRDEGIAALANVSLGGGLPKLRELGLSGNQIGPEGMRALGAASENGAFRVLEQLNLNRNPLGDAGLVALGSALEKGGLPVIEALFFYQNKIGDEGLKALVGAAFRGKLPKLKLLNLNENPLSGESVASVGLAIRGGKLPRLKFLYVDPQHADNQTLRAEVQAGGGPPTPRVLKPIVNPGPWEVMADTS